MFLEASTINSGDGRQITKMDFFADFFLSYLSFSSSFDFCKDSEKRNPSENLGQVLFGERISSSPYKVIQLIFLLNIISN